MTESYDYMLKFLIIGSAGCGKSCLLRQFIDKKFQSNMVHTIGVEFGSRNVVVNDKNIKLQIWDTAGQERFKAVTRSYYRGAVGALLVFDKTNRASFSALLSWLQDARSLASPHIVILLVGNKKDLEDEREVEFKEASDFAEEHNLTYLETSAKTGENVEESFISCTSRILEKIENGDLDPARCTAGIQAGHTNERRTQNVPTQNRFSRSCTTCQ